MHLPQVLSNTRNHTNHIIPIDHIMYGLMNITPIYLLMKITHQGTCNFNSTQKAFFGSTITISIPFHVNFTSMIHPEWNPP